MVYVDGTRVANTALFYWTVRFIANSSSRVLAVEITNINIGFKSNVGFILQSSAGIVSDQSWKCASNDLLQFDDWTTTEYDDTSWSYAVCYARNGDIFKVYPDYRPLEGFAASTCWISTTTAEVNSWSKIKCRKLLNRCTQ